MAPTRITDRVCAPKAVSSGSNSEAGIGEDGWIYIVVALLAFVIFVALALIYQRRRRSGAGAIAPMKDGGAYDYEMGSPYADDHGQYDGYDSPKGAGVGGNAYLYVSATDEPDEIESTYMGAVPTPFSGSSRTDSPYGAPVGGGAYAGGSRSNKSVTFADAEQQVWMYAECKPFLQCRALYYRIFPKLTSDPHLVILQRREPRTGHATRQSVTSASTDEEDLDDAIAALQSIPTTDNVAVQRRPSNPRSGRGASMASVVSTESALGDVHLPPPPPLDELAEEEERARLEREATAAQAERDRQAQREAEARARRAEEARARREAEAQAKVEADAKARAKREAEAEAKREAEARAKREAEAMAKREAAAKAAVQSATPAASSARAPPDYHAPHQKPADDVLKRLGITPHYGGGGDDEYPTFKAEGAPDVKTFTPGTGDVSVGDEANLI